MSEAASIMAEAARQENVTRILDLLNACFRHYGYSKTNVADIARELGNVARPISTASFASKVEIHQGRLRPDARGQLPDGLRDFPLAGQRRGAAASLCCTRNTR